MSVWPQKIEIDDNSSNEQESEFLRLPNEVLSMIFELIPVRFELAAVCRKFYEILIYLERFSFVLSVHCEDTLLDFVTFSSILNSSRSLDSISLNITSRFNQLCWDRLKRLLSLAEFRSITITSTDPRHSTNVSVSVLLTKLRRNILRKLNLTNVDLTLLTSFFRDQMCIQSLSITGSVNNVEIFKRLELFRLKLVGPRSKQLKEIISSQQNLTSLKLTLDDDTDYNIEVFKGICSLERLEELEVPFGQTLETQSILMLNGLSRLKKLSLNFTGLSFSLFAAAVRLPSLIELDATVDETISQDVIHHLSQSIPNVSSIKLKGPLMINFLRDFVHHFKLLESLWIENEESYFVNVVHPPPMLDARDNLKHLAVVNNSKKYMLFPNDLVRFLDVLGSLKTLVILRYVEVQVKNLRNILVNLPALEEILIEASSLNSTTNVMDVIKHHGSHLKVIKFENFMTYCDAENLKTFFEGIFPVIEKKDKTLTLRKHEKLYLQKTLY